MLLKFFHFYTKLGGSLTQDVFVIYMVTFKMNLHYAECVTLATNLVIQIFLVAILKLFHHEPRPFWENSAITPDKCYVQFGNPSGHAICATFFASYLGLVYVR